MVNCSFTWPSMKEYGNRYTNGYKSCQQVKPGTQNLFGTLEPLPILVGAWTDNSYDLITGLPLSIRFYSILTMIDQLTNMVHFIPCIETMESKKPSDLMTQNVWNLHGTPKKIFYIQGSVFILQVTRELDKHPGIKLNPCVMFHSRTGGKSQINNKAIK